MLYEKPLIDADFLKRYKRFFADIQMDKSNDVAHVPNTGSLKGVCDHPLPCRVSASNNPERKLKWTLEQVKTSTTWVGVNTHRANAVAREAIEKKLLPQWQNLTSLTAEVKWTKETRFDFAADLPDGRRHFIEVKSVTLAEGDTALFPDAKTERGQKHLLELMNVIAAGHSAEIVFLIQRTDVRRFRPADQIDPEYARLLADAQKAGVILSAIKVSPEKKGLIIDESSSVQIQLNK